MFKLLITLKLLVIGPINVLTAYRKSRAGYRLVGVSVGWAQGLRVGGPGVGSKFQIWVFGRKL